MVWFFVIFFGGIISVGCVCGYFESLHLNAHNRIHYKNSIVKTLWKDEYLAEYKRGEIGYTNGEFKRKNDNEEYVKVYFDEKREIYVPIKRLKWISYVDKDEIHEENEDYERKDNIQEQER